MINSGFKEKKYKTISIDRSKGNKTDIILKKVSEKELDEYYKKQKGLKKYSGTIEGKMVNITPLYTEGQKLKTGNSNNIKVRKDNNFSPATTFKSCIRKTSFYINPLLSCSIFGSHKAAGKVYFILKNQKVSIGNLKVPRMFSPKKEEERIYYNEVPKAYLDAYNTNKNNLSEIFCKNMGERNMLLEKTYLPKSEFYIDIIFENLTEDELKLLIYSLELPKIKDKYYNQIGMGKSYGMGIIYYKINSLVIDDENKFLNLFFENNSNRIEEFKEKIKLEINNYDFKDKNIRETYIIKKG